MYQYTKALVSVITPGWNGKDFVHRLLDSLIKQTYKTIEYIYVDDGSTDGTSEIVKAYQTRFQEAGISFNYIYKTNGGVSTAVEEGLKHV
ncbi:glycosyltransferase family A protein, partial [Hallella sp.]